MTSNRVVMGKSGRQVANSVQPQGRPLEQVNLSTKMGYSNQERTLGPQDREAKSHSTVSKRPKQFSSSILGFLIWHSDSNNTCPTYLVKEVAMTTK